MSYEKISTGIEGLDSILRGGYIACTPTLIKGGPGTGKTLFTLLFAAELLRSGQAVVVVTCDESPDRLVGYLDELGHEGSQYKASGHLVVLDFRPNLNDMLVGDYDLSPILRRIENALKQSGAKALVLDSLQNLLLGLGETGVNLDLLNLFDWVREQSLTALVTMSITEEDKQRSHLEEYAVDSVIVLSQTVEERMMTRELRVIKMRGSGHGTNQYPYAITEEGVFLMPVTAASLDTEVQPVRITTGVEHLDEMLGGEGYLKGSNVMLSGRSGTGKTIFALTMADAAIRQGLSVFYFSFEESEHALVHNLRSVSVDLEQPINEGKLTIRTERAVEKGLETHLISIINDIEKANPDVVILDPISSLVDLGSPRQVKMLLIRFCSYIAGLGRTLVMTELLPDNMHEFSDFKVSSLVDTWIKLRQVEQNGELNRLLHVVKSRGSSSSNQIKEFILTDDGISVEEPYIGSGEIVFGAAKVDLIAQDEEQEGEIRYKQEQIQLELDSLQENMNVRKQAIETEHSNTRRELNKKLNELNRQAAVLKKRRNLVKKIREA